MLIGTQNLTDRVNHVRSRISHAALAAGRNPDAITLVAVTKGKIAEIIGQAATAGVTDFGENYLNEALPKMNQLGALEVNWHYIGQMQSNKTRSVANSFAWVHSLDRLGIAKRLSEQRPFHAPLLQVCLQVALISEPTKGGVAPALLPELAASVAQLPRLQLRGLMCIPPPQLGVTALRALFARLRQLKDELNANGLKLDTLSMGMSADFESAIAEGATMVRIGTALFGEREL
jgi:pyridoxal phosphate enzyme (YggS family)